jgi:hypothetical protein
MPSILQARKKRKVSRGRKSVPLGFAAAVFVAILFFYFSATELWASPARDASSPGLVTEISASREDVLAALQQVLDDTIVHGTYMYEKDKTLTGAAVARSTPLFEAWHEDGAVLFYKIRAGVIAPRHFRDSADQGTIAVRYVVSSVTPERTRLRIDAVFVETARRIAHPSDGAVESSEYKIIEARLQEIQRARQEAADEQRRRASAELAVQAAMRLRDEESERLATLDASAKDIEAQVRFLRSEVEERVNAAGAELKAAPFRSASAIATLPPYTDLLIVIVTPYWHGVETSTGQRGWIPIDRVESRP